MNWEGVDKETRQAPAPKSVCSSSTEMCCCPRRHAKCLLEKGFIIGQAKIELSDHSDKRHVWRLSSLSTLPAIKRGGGSIMICGWFAASPTGPTLHKACGIMEEVNLQILYLHLKSAVTWNMEKTDPNGLPKVTTSTLLKIQGNHPI